MSSTHHTQASQPTGGGRHMTQNRQPMTGKTVLITGATSGIGGRDQRRRRRHGPPLRR